MKNTLFRTVISSAAVLLFAAVLFGQAPERIDFVKDGPSQVWNQPLLAKSSKEFVLYLKKGQRVRIGYIEESGKGTMGFGKLSIEEGFDNALEMDVEVSKDYNLSIYNSGNKLTDFRLSISLLDTRKTVGNSRNDGNNGNNGSYVSIDTSEMTNVERVQFGPGTIERNYSRTVAANDAKRFLFSAKAGQEVVVVVTPQRKGAALMIDISDREVKAGEPFSMKAPRTGDYLVQVINADNAARTFDINLGVADAEKSDGVTTDAAATLNGDRIQFHSGETSAMVTRDIPAQASVDFILGARKGQTLGYTVGYDFKDSDVQAFLTEPGMQDISKTSGPKAPQEFVIKKTGDHRITVNNMTRKKITITLYVDVE